jgi:hypothetical protein
VKGVDGGNELWLTRSQSLVSQVTGEVEYSFRSNDAKLRTVNDAIEVTAAEKSNAPRFLVPVLEIVSDADALVDQV